MDRTVNVAAQKAPFTEFSSRVDRAVATAKSVSERKVFAVPEDALNETYRRAAAPVSAGTRLKLAVDEATGQVIGRIVERDSGKVVTQIPSEEILKLIARTKETLGSLVNEKV